MIGNGSGMSSHLLLGSPTLEKLVTIDIEPEMINGSHLFYPVNKRVFDDPRARYVHDDAKSYFASQNRKFDLILSEPSNPWMVGVGSVFSREFYELCASRLKDGGIMTQWFHVYEMHDGIVQLVFHTFATVFPHVELWDPGTGDLILLGSQKPLIAWMRV